MVSSAVYRYFAGRDELLTALIVDAYDALGEATERAEAVVERSDLRGRWLAACRGVRGWALAHPHEYALIYGSPVPGYRAPQDTVEPSSRPTQVLAGILRDGVAAGELRVAPGTRLPRPVRADLAHARSALFHVPEPILACGFTAWIQLFGVVSFELFGRFETLIEDRDAYFDHQMRVMADLVGLP